MKCGTSCGCNDCSGTGVVSPMARAIMLAGRMGDPATAPFPPAAPAPFFQPRSLAPSGAPSATAIAWGTVALGGAVTGAVVGGISGLAAAGSGRRLVGTGIGAGVGVVTGVMAFVGLAAVASR
jgi:hypothetical protein